MTAPLSVYFKSAVAGTVAAAGAAVVICIVAVITLIGMSGRAEEGISYGWDPVAFVRTPLAWAILLLAFSVGFYWQYYRALHGH